LPAAAKNFYRLNLNQFFVYKLTRKKSAKLYSHCLAPLAPFSYFYSPFYMHDHDQSSPTRVVVRRRRQAGRHLFLSEAGGCDEDSSLRSYDTTTDYALLIDALSPYPLRGISYTYMAA
jgi:hypothetical protein